MRIVAGKYGGRKLYVPPGRDVRPTTDKVRGAIFNALHSRGAVEGAQVFDCFCGSGALGLEALSRGAVHCTFIDKSRASIEAAQKNAESFGVMEHVTFLCRDVARLNAPDVQADLVFLDPPYGRDLMAGALETLHQKSSMKDGALCVAEMDKRDAVDIPQMYKVLDERLYGDTKILTLSYTSTPA